MFFKKNNKSNNKASRQLNSKDVDNYEIFDETKNKEVTRAIFGKQPSDEIYSKRIYSAPHMIVAGTTGSGKSVNVNSLLGSMMLTATPKQLRFIIIDPKAVEFSAYNDSPYMITNPITDMDKASKALKWLVNLMQERYDMMRRMGEKGLEVPKNIEEYNDMVKDREEEEMYYTVAVVDEFSDLIGEHPEVEGYVVRIAQKARACGISLIIATQSPRSNVITGLIKANIPTRVCMMVVSSLESNIILDEGGGELLRPHGDMLIKFNGSSELVRCQGPYISNKSIKNLIEFSKKHYSYLNKPIDIFENMSEDDDDDMSMGMRNRRPPRHMMSQKNNKDKNKEEYIGKDTRKSDISESSEALLSSDKLFDKPSEERTEEEIKESKKDRISSLEEKQEEIQTNKNNTELKETNIETQNNTEVINMDNQPKNKPVDDVEKIKQANREKINEFNNKKKMLKTRNMVNKTKENADFLMSDYAMRQHYQNQKNKEKTSLIKNAMNKVDNSTQDTFTKELKNNEQSIDKTLENKESYINNNNTEYKEKYINDNNIENKENEPFMTNGKEKGDFQH